MDDSIIVEQFRAFLYNSIRNGTRPFAFYQQYNQASAKLQSKLIVHKLCEQLVEVACCDYNVHPLLYEYVDVMIKNGVFTMMDFIQLLTKFNNVKVVDVSVSFVRKVTDYLKIIKCDFDDEKDRLELCYVYITVVKWLVELACLSITKRISEQITLIDAVIEGLKFVATDKFARTILYFVCKDDNEALIEMLDSLNYVEDMFNRYDANGGQYHIEAPHKIETLKHLVEDFSRKPEFCVTFLKTYRFGANKSEPIILSMCSTFSTFRLLISTAEMSQSFRNMALILQYDNVKLVKDLLRGAFVCQLDAYKNDSRAVMADIFVFCRIPTILSSYRNEFLETKEMIKALSDLSLSKTLFNGIDHFRQDDTFANFLECLQGERLLESEQVDRLITERHSNKGDSDLFPNFSNLSMDISINESKYAKLQTAISLCEAFKACYRTEDDSKYREILSELFSEMSVDVIDLFIGVLCSQNELYEFLNVVAEMNRTCESFGTEDKSSLHFYDLTVIFIFRVRFLLPDIIPEDLCGGIEDSFIFSWFNSYNKCLYSDASELPQDTKDYENLAYQRVKQGINFWDPSKDISCLLKLIPVVGEGFLTEFSKVVDMGVEKVLESFGDVASAYVVWVQWLHMKKTPQKYEIAVAIKENVKRHIKKFQGLKDDFIFKRWRMADEVLSELVRSISAGIPPHETTYPVLINCAIGDIRSLRVNETPDMTMLKNAFFIASQKGYICQNVLSYVVDLNRKKEFDRWITCWLQQVCKHESVDELEAETELCIAAALSLPTECFLRLATLLLEDNNFSAFSESKPSEYNHIWALARMLVRILFVLCWIKQQSVIENSKFNERRRMRRKRRARNYRCIPSASEPESFDQAIDAILKTVVEKFDLVLKKTILDHKKTYASFFIKEIISCPPNPFQKQVLRLMPQEMFLNTINRTFDDIHIAAFLNSFGMDDEVNRKFCLHVVCLLRKLKQI